ncbi:MAG: response regulator, partial [Pedosphaera parvula]|nr:response regulator [Pedosphaera parvula]
PATAHLPILAFSGQKDDKLQAAARAAGATLVASKEGILAQLPMLLEQVLEVN